MLYFQVKNRQYKLGKPHQPGFLGLDEVEGDKGDKDSDSKLRYVTYK